jgi:hypothetical protein
MKNWCKFLTSILSLVAIMSMASISASQSFTSSQPYQSEQSINISFLQQGLISASSSASQMLSDEEQGVSFDLSKNSITTDSEFSSIAQDKTEQPEQLLLQARTTYCAFGSLKQTSPVFYFKMVLEPPGLLSNLEQIIDSVDLTSPWFIKHNQTSSRISGWKDGNSLYTSLITYHS